MDIPDSRKNFNTTWLTESPEGIGSLQIIDMIIYNIRDYIKNKPDAVSTLSNGWKKIEGITNVWYWVENTTGKIVLAAEFEKAPQALVVRAIGKIGKGTSPFASDLYDLVLRDRKNLGGIDAIRIVSDNQLSDEGYKIWERLLSLGHKIGVYDREAPGKTFTGITTKAELAKFFKDDDRSFRRYQYVLSESSHYGETRSCFNTRRMRELSKLSVD